MDWMDNLYEYGEKDHDINLIGRRTYNELMKSKFYEKWLYIEDYGRAFKFIVFQKVYEDEDPVSRRIIGFNNELVYEFEGSFIKQNKLTVYPHGVDVSNEESLNELLYNITKKFKTKV